jgi:hypothetical protein
MAIDNASTLLQLDINPVLNWLGTYWEQIVATTIPAAGVIVSVVTYVFQRKKFRLTALTEAFRLLNDVKHREARKVVYDKPNMSSFDIFGLVRPPTSGGEVREEELTHICRDIVRSDFNQIGTLIHHDLLDGKIFIEEYYWIILKIWSSLKDEIERRRNSIGPPNYMQHLEYMYRQVEEYAKEHDTKAYNRFHNTSATTETPRNEHHSKV